MTKSVMLSLLNRAATGNEMLAMIDSFTDNQPAFDYIESPMIETALVGQPTLDPIEFWFDCATSASVH